MGILKGQQDYKTISDTKQHGNVGKSLRFGKENKYTFQWSRKERNSKWGTKETAFHWKVLPVPHYTFEAIISKNQMKSFLKLLFWRLHRVSFMSQNI